MLRLRKNSQGFTIIELMIATAVFGLVLLLVSNGAIQIGRAYYKNITTAKTQENAREVINDISGQLQLSKGNVSSASSGGGEDPKVICIGNVRYTYQINKQVKNTQHGLWRDETPSGCAPAVPFNPANAEEVIGEGLRLLKLEVTGSGDFWTVKVKVAYGDNDLLTHYPDNATPTTPAYAGWTADSVQCKPARQAVSTFCAVSALEIKVKRR